MLLGCGVQVAGRLIGEDQRGGGHQGARDGDALTFALGELVGAALQEPVDSQVGCEALGSGAGGVVEPEVVVEPVRVEDVLQHVEVVEEEEEDVPF